MKKIISSATLLSLVLSLSIVYISFPNKAKAQNIGTLQSIVTPGFSFRKDLRLGDTDPDVKELQRVLNADIDTMVALESEGSRGRETTYFGNLTKNAVIKFQNKYKDIVLTLNSITTADGLVNKATRTRLNLLIGVMNTYDSVGFPQNRASSNISTTVYVPPATIAVSQPSMTNCQFVELLIDIDAISSANSAKARGVFNCAGGSIVNLTPSVDIKANSKNGPITITSPRNVTISWTSSNVTSCITPGGSKPVSGSQTIYVDASGIFAISCNGPYGSATDDVVVMIEEEDDNQNNNQNTENMTVSCQSSPATVGTGGSITWTADVSGGSGSNSYSWSGSDSLSGSNRFISKLYSTAGLKIAQVSVTSGSQVLTASCNVTVTAGINNSSVTAVNKVLNLAGERGDYVAVKNSSSIALSGAITLEAWVKPTGWVTPNNEAPQGISTIVVKGQIAESWDYWFGLDNGKIYYSNGSNGTPVTTCSPVVSLNEWSHVAVSISGNSISMYLNGNKVNSLCGGTSSVGISKSSKNLYIGNIYPKYCSASWFNYGFKGLIDDVRIWNTARTASEILSSTSTIATSTATSTLAARWTFDSGFAVDVTGNGNNGSMFGINSGTVSGAPVIVDNATSPSTLVAGDVPFSYAYVNDNFCEMEEMATTTPELPDPKTDISGKVTRVAKCLATPSGFSLTEVEIQPCGLGQNVQRYEPDPMGNMLPSGSMSGNIFITLRDNMHDAPSVGDLILARVVPDSSGTCTSLAGGLAPSSYSYEGIITSDYQHSPDTSNQCSSGANATGSSSDGWGFDMGILRFNEGGATYLGTGIRWGDNPGVSYFGNTIKITKDEGRIFGIKLW